MKYILMLVILFTGGQLLFSQEKVEIYDTSLDGMKQIEEAVLKAASENKNILIQVGGNWCPWCVKFNRFCNDVHEIDSIIKASYVFIHLNYSKENKNLKSLERLGFPQRFGFPVMVIINGKGERLHTQDSGLLEKDKGYDTLKVVTFLKNWTTQALNPENYIIKN